MRHRAGTGRLGAGAQPLRRPHAPLRDQSMGVGACRGPPRPRRRRGGGLERRQGGTGPRRVVLRRPGQPAHRAQPAGDQPLRARRLRAAQRLDVDHPLRRLPGRRRPSPGGCATACPRAGLLQGPSRRPQAAGRDPHGVRGRGGPDRPPPRRWVHRGLHHPCRDLGRARGHARHAGLHLRRRLQARHPRQPRPHRQPRREVPHHPAPHPQGGRDRPGLDRRRRGPVARDRPGPPAGARTTPRSSTGPPRRRHPRRRATASSGPARRSSGPTTPHREASASSGPGRRSARSARSSPPGAAG